MDAKVSTARIRRPSKEEAENAVRVLLAYAGDDPQREGLLETPARVTRAFAEYYSGYGQSYDGILAKTFSETAGYDDMVMLRDIEFTSHCEHHMAPFVGRAHVAYVPKGSVVGISKLARVVDVFARRLQTQENMTAQIADAILDGLEASGVAVMLEAVHSCMAMRGVAKRSVATITTQFRGRFKTDVALQARFMQQLRGPERGFSF
jgi:GTP cyclohydrolase IA